MLALHLIFKRYNINRLHEIRNTAMAFLYINMSLAVITEVRKAISVFMIIISSLTAVEGDPSSWTMREGEFVEMVSVISSVVCVALKVTNVFHLSVMSDILYVEVQARFESMTV